MQILIIQRILCFYINDIVVHIIPVNQIALDVNNNVNGSI